MVIGSMTKGRRACLSVSLSPDRIVIVRGYNEDSVDLKRYSIIVFFCSQRLCASSLTDSIVVLQCKARAT